MRLLHWSPPRQFSYIPSSTRPLWLLVVSDVWMLFLYKYSFEKNIRHCPHMHAIVFTNATDCISTPVGRSAAKSLPQFATHGSSCLRAYVPTHGQTQQSLLREEFWCFRPAIASARVQQNKAAGASPRTSGMRRPTRLEEAKCVKKYFSALKIKRKISKFHYLFI